MASLDKEATENRTWTFAGVFEFRWASLVGNGVPGAVKVLFRTEVVFTRRHLVRRSDRVLYTIAEWPGKLDLDFPRECKSVNR